MTADVQRDLAAITLAHRHAGSQPGTIWCSCGWTGTFLSQHQAEQLAVAVQALIADAEKRAAAAHQGIVREATDLCWKATPFTEDETGAVAAYLLPSGVVHRLLGQLQGAGYPAAFRAIAAPPAALDPSGAAEGAGR